MSIRVATVMVVFALLGAGCTAMGVSGVASPQPADDGRSAQQRHDDAQVAQRVTAAFVSDPRISALDIDVSCFRGVVTLSGRVPAREVMQRAVKVAAGESGVERVVNRLRVSSP